MDLPGGSLFCLFLPRFKDWLKQPILTNNKKGAGFSLEVSLLQWIRFKGKPRLALSQEKDSKARRTAGFGSAIRVENPASGDPRIENAREKVKACFAPRKYYGKRSSVR